MGTITGISDLDPVRWKNSQWRNLQVPLPTSFNISLNLNSPQEIHIFVLSFLSLICVSNGCLVLHIIGQVGWDESTAGEKRSRVSIWEIEPVTAPFFLCPPPFFRSKRPRQPGMPGK